MLKKKILSFKFRIVILLPIIIIVLLIVGNCYINYKNTNKKSIAHQGYNLNAPNETIPAYTEAAKHGFKYGECDVKFTSDGIPVILHDTFINNFARNTDGTKITVDQGKTIGSYTISSSDINKSISVTPTSADVGKMIGKYAILSSDVGGSITVTPTNYVYIANKTYSELLDYDFGIWKSSTYAGTKICTFEEYVACCKKYGLGLYIDDVGVADTPEKLNLLFSIVDKYRMRDKATWLVGSSTSIAQKILTWYPKARIGFTIQTYTTDFLQSIMSLKTNLNDIFIDCLYTGITTEDIAEIRKTNIGVELWTIDDSTTYKTLIPYVDGITSDRYAINDIK